MFICLLTVGPLAVPVDAADNPTDTLDSGIVADDSGNPFAGCTQEIHVLSPQNAHALSPMAGNTDIAQPLTVEYFICPRKSQDDHKPISPDILGRISCPAKTSTIPGANSTASSAPLATQPIGTLRDGKSINCAFGRAAAAAAFVDLGPSYGTFRYFYQIVVDGNVYQSFEDDNVYCSGTFPWGCDIYSKTESAPNIRFYYIAFYWQEPTPADLYYAACL